MAATYINGNTFQVEFILWKKDIVSYFWHAYFFHPLEYLKRQDSKRFLHAIAYSSLLCISLLIASFILNLNSYPFLILYFPFVTGILMYNHYRKTIQTSKPLLERHYSFVMEPNEMRIMDNHSKEEVIIASNDILSIAEKKDMIIIYTHTDEYIIPTRVLEDSQIESVLAFK